MLAVRITIQWHLTDVCNYRCKHCYQDNYKDSGVDFTELLNYYKRLEKFVLELKGNRKIFNAHINFTGGEPFLKSELLDLLRIVKEKNVFSFGILSNGFLLPENELTTLQLLRPKFIQLSLEGNEQINDSIRGTGSFGEIVRAIKTYRKYKIPVLISFTANSKNYESFTEVVKIARKYNVYKVWTDRYLPKGLKDELAMSTDQVRDFFEIILSEQKKKIPNLLSKTIISSSRALQFLVNGGQPYGCSAGKTLLTILPNGDILPCRRMPIKVGNLYSDDLMDIYQNSNTLNNLRCLDHLDNNCKKCYYFNTCSGGLKCLSFANYGDFNIKDPHCWI